MYWKPLSLIFFWSLEKGEQQWEFEESKICCRFGEGGKLSLLMLWSLLEVTVLACRKEWQVTLLHAFMHFPWDQRVIAEFSEHQCVVLSDRAVIAWLWEPGWSSSLHLKAVIHQFFSQMHGSVNKYLSKLQVSRLQASPSSDGIRRGP